MNQASRIKDVARLANSLRQSHVVQWEAVHSAISLTQELHDKAPIAEHEHIEQILDQLVKIECELGRKL